MQHFSEHVWTDYVRGASGTEISADIKAHLAEGCSQCKPEHDLWSRVPRIAAEESRYAPPDNLVRLVKLGFARKLAVEPKTWTLANLIFDSSTQPLLAGVRGALSTWQVIYSAEGLAVDMHFGRRAPSSAIHVIGQVLDQNEVQTLPGNATIELSTDQDRVIATTVASDSGEFHIEFYPKDPLWLLVKAKGRNAVRIPLKNLKQR